MYTEVAGSEGEFKGYVKPVIQDLKVTSSDNSSKDAIRKLWEGAVGAVGELLSSPDEDQIATKVPMEGEFEDTTISTWFAIAKLLRNAFIQSLLPSVDHEINLASVEDVEEEEDTGFFKELFGGDGDKENEEE